MSEPADWALAYARQDDADFGLGLYEHHPEPAVAAECSRAWFGTAMSCEKLVASPRERKYEQRQSEVVSALAQPTGYMADRRHELAMVSRLSSVTGTAIAEKSKQRA